MFHRVNWFGGWSVTPCSDLTWSIRHAGIFVVFYAVSAVIVMFYVILIHFVVLY